MMGTQCRAQMRTACCASSVDLGNATASGAVPATHVVVLQCCSRIACDTERRSPNKALSSACATAKPAPKAGFLNATTMVGLPKLLNLRMFSHQVAGVNSLL